MHVPARTAIWALLCALSLGLVQVAHAQTQQAAASNFDWAQVKATGNTTRVGVEIGGNKTAVSPLAELLNKSGHYSSEANASGFKISGNLQGPVGPAKNVPLKLTGNITKAAAADGMGMLFRNAARLSGPLGILMIMNDFADRLDAMDIKRNPAAELTPDTPFLVYEEQSYCDITPGMRSSWMSWIESMNGVHAGDVYTPVVFVGPRSSNPSVGSGFCQLGANLSWADPDGAGPGTGGSGYYGGYNTVSKLSAPTGPGQPASWDQVSGNMRNAPGALPSDIVQKQIDWAKKQEGKNGIEPWKIAVTGIAVAGASTAGAPTVDRTTTTSTRPSSTGSGTDTVTTTTTKTTSTGLGYSGDTVKATPTTTTTTETTVTDPNGNTTSEPPTTETQTDNDKETPTPEQNESDLCEKNPDILACAKPELDTPDEDIPRVTKDVTYTPETLFGEGSCPAPVVANISGGRTLTFSYDQYCSAIVSYVKPAVLVLALFGAYLIMLPGLGVKL